METKDTKARVAVIGELNVDIVASGLARPPELGAEIIAADLEITLGSASAIFASGVSKLGHPVNFISKVGADDYGRFCLEALRNLGVSTDKIKLDEAAKTGVTLALSTRSDRALVTYLGTISTLRAAEIDLTELADCRHLHMT
ncbi:MAG TPA: carbohydrate kinase family protein, partial [Pyrinomonadaceae bacterium]